jgi:hypothetical protein
VAVVVVPRRRGGGWLCDQAAESHLTLAVLAELGSFEQAPPAFRNDSCLVSAHHNGPHVVNCIEMLPPALITLRNRS